MGNKNRLSNIFLLYCDEYIYLFIFLFINFVDKTHKKEIMHKQASNLRKKHRHIKNNLLTDEYIYTGDRKGEMHIYLTQYDADN